jgi:bifunctional ADP-heptose synthase (sugar kinase/adenylyltransferase)
VPGLRPPDDERIPVAAPRPPQRDYRPRRGVQDATGAGLTIIVVGAAFAALGAWLSGKLGLAPLAGAILLGFAGVVLGFVAVFVRFRSL